MGRGTLWISPLEVGQDASRFGDVSAIGHGLSWPSACRFIARTILCALVNREPWPEHARPNVVGIDTDIAHSKTILARQFPISVKHPLVQFAQKCVIQYVALAHAFNATISLNKVDLLSLVQFCPKKVLGKHKPFLFISGQRRIAFILRVARPNIRQPVRQHPPEGGGLRKFAMR